MKLRTLPSGDTYGLSYQCVFGGLDARLSAADGAVSAMENMSADHYPLLAPRGGRYKLRTLSAPNGLGAGDCLFWVDGTDFYYDGAVKGQVADSPKRFYTMNRWVVIWPDKLAYNTATEEFGPLEAMAAVDGEVQKARFLSSPAPGGISSRGNCLVLDSVTLDGVFRPGDGVTIAGCTAHPENNLTLVVREVHGTALYFYDESFTLDTLATYTAGAEGLAPGCWHFLWNGRYYNITLETALGEGDTVTWDGESASAVIGGETVTLPWDIGAFGIGTIGFTAVETLDYAEPGAVTVCRSVPDLEHLCQSGNRLWGVMDSAVYCSALGDPRVWNNFDGTATGCWSVEAGSGGAFTGAVAYGGYPLLMKEDRIYRVYGTRPANFQLMDTQTLGCEKGSEKGFAVVGQTLYYKTRAGFAAYAGGVPGPVDDALGVAFRQNAVAGSDGRKYYVSVEEQTGHSLYVYDTALGLWHREDDARVLDFAWCGGELYMLCADGALWQCGRVRTPQGEGEGFVESAVEFADFYGGTVRQKTIRRLYFRVETARTLTLSVSYDGRPFEPVATVTRAKKGIQTLQLIPRRCDSLRIRLEGSGDWKVWAMGREYTK